MDLVSSGHGKICHGKPASPGVPQEIHDLIREMSRNNSDLGVPRAFTAGRSRLVVEITEPMVANCMVRDPKHPATSFGINGRSRHWTIFSALGPTAVTQKCIV